MESLKTVDEKLVGQINRFCSHVVSTNHITAICLVDNYDVRLDSEKKALLILLIIRNFQPRLKSYIKELDNRTFLVFAVDKSVFERDVDQGFLGEALAEKMIFPYTALANADYLHLQEVKLKKRLIRSPCVSAFLYFALCLSAFF